MTENPNLELQSLLAQLKCKVSATEVPSQGHQAVVDFLRQELSAQNSCRRARLLAASGMNKFQVRTFEQFDWAFNPEVPRQEISAFRSASWVASASNLVLIGDTGLGKSHIAKALCYEAIQQGFSAYFISAFDLIAKIKKAAQPANRIDYYGKALRVLAIDELGYTVYQKDDADILFQVFSKRSELLPTIVTSNLIPKKWGSIFSGPAASAILDRLSYNGHFLNWEGPSYRARSRKK